MNKTKKIFFKLNGKEVSATVDTRLTLLELLRDVFHLTSPKKGCDETVCGACAVLVNNRAICSCSMLAVEVDGSEVITLEGLGSENNLDPLQEAFIKFDALQCGFCTPGQIISAKSLILNMRGEITDEDIKDALSGNICRCGAYINILQAVKYVVQKVREKHDNNN
ncbi:(2Fe-2S)-binding protein [Sulfolobus sp. E11-6]|uniref:(2Fe-2S)-binding protein n=1 Tax=Sulfolobus sp. E11-6 TaxID=2663020 RepID=UPI0012970207|nr:(2Fe-2S)-binding protein [Sulfolobus sp. E11-6]QGA69048.1 2Fe-2S iron-sulfur cluster binding domain-containing protein [Sulfolobus sp. E11-6]